MMLYRPDYYSAEKEDDDDSQEMQVANKAEVIVAKNRHGSTDTVKMGWIGRYTKFRTIAEGQEAQ